jgi:large subunit ribosomal protein L15e
MGLYQKIAETFQEEYKNRNELYRKRLEEWRKQGAIVRVEKPTNIARARTLGYRAKQGVIIVRVKVRKGLRKRPKPDLGRKPSKMGRFFSTKKSLQRMAEERAAAKYKNFEVLNSYFVGEDGKSKFFEVIMLDRNSPSIKNDKIYSKIIAQKGRVFKGLTSEGKKNRGLRSKGKGTEKSRPSIRTNRRRR